MTRAGYLQWRADLEEISCPKGRGNFPWLGYTEDVVHRVQDLNLKKNFPDDTERPRAGGRPLPGVSGISVG